MFDILIWSTLWINRTFLSKLQALLLSTLKQCDLPTVRVLLDDLRVRHRTTESPSFFLDQFSGPFFLDEATHSPELFSEIKTGRFSEIAAAVGVESSTVQSWALTLEQNQIIKIVRPDVSSLNKRIIKSPKVYPH
ncbi:MAG: hypothetical protein IPK04_20145 [Bdellovibrionales bacterium]|nr:hypothetical protein [Bdellovibrionales bacterium]